MLHIELKPFTWIHPNGTFSSRCDLDIFMIGDRVVVVATEREEDPDSGMSISNGADTIATIVMQKYGLNPEAITWIEHYPEKKMGPIYRMGETYDLVRFRFKGNRFVSPSWDRIDRNGAEAFIRVFRDNRGIL